MFRKCLPYVYYLPDIDWPEAVYYNFDVKDDNTCL